MARYKCKSSGPVLYRNGARLPFRVSLSAFADAPFDRPARRRPEKGTQFEALNARLLWPIRRRYFEFPAARILANHDAPHRPSRCEFISRSSFPVIYRRGDNHILRRIYVRIIIALLSVTLVRRAQCRRYRFIERSPLICVFVRS